jgi:hypothetical protein
MTSAGDQAYSIGMPPDQNVNKAKELTNLSTMTLVINTKSVPSSFAVCQAQFPDKIQIRNRIGLQNCIVFAGHVN